ncbi:hypothetical protein [Halobacillus mangrovi]|uniref:hypothetical protein n=1 Tax=Halobacillus mangrovi TaxID=402384 RepID=UPI003D973DFD
MEEKKKYNEKSAESSQNTVNIDALLKFATSMFKDQSFLDRISSNDDLNLSKNLGKVFNQSYEKSNTKQMEELKKEVTDLRSEIDQINKQLEESKRKSKISQIILKCKQWFI